MSMANKIGSLAELQRQFPEYLSLKWTNVIVSMLREGNYTVNEISRLLKLDHDQRRRLSATACIMKYKMRVRKRHDRLQLVGGDINSRQSDLTEY